MNKEFKRKTRHLSPVTRQKISNALKGRSKSDEQKERTRASMLSYWSDDRNFPADADKEDEM
ncbi:MAG: hypothetical protein IKW89_04250 [Bacteroidales bacterium]|nr:hypothetical protein [Bacteroidales bacterium]